MKNKDELIHKLIFSDENQFVLDIGDYTEDIYNYENFIDGIKDILRKSKVSIIKTDITVNSTGVIWKIKIRK
jgi:hypothetical protein